MSCTNCATGKDGKPVGCKSNGYCSTSGCNKLEVFDWLTGVPLPHGQALFDAVEIRFKNTRKSFYRVGPELSVLPGDLVVVEGGPGFDLGVITLTGELVRAQMRRKEVAPDTFALRKVLRKATQPDIDGWHAARKQEEETLLSVRRMAREASLDMKVSDVEYQGDGTRATVYYTSEERIDFRPLLRQMGDRFGVRMEMRQIGARQESGRLGGIGSCGRELCCSTWLTDLRSVTTSAARYQQLALNPQKLAGQCGKLKCCLNYELDMYMEAVKSYPSENAKLKTKQGVGVHMKTDIFQARMFYLFKSPGQASTMVGLQVPKVREILEANRQGEEPEIDLRMLQLVAEAPKENVPAYQNAEGEDELTRFDNKVARRQGRGRDGRGRRQAPQGLGAPRPVQGSPPPQLGPGQAHEARRRRKRNDRRGGDRPAPPPSQ
jgi:cell fate regulator YaaT (PSP1 superfamily)